MNIAMDGQASSLGPQPDIMELGVGRSRLDSTQYKEEEERVGGDAEFEVFWDSPANQDHTNPMNWSVPRKWAIIAMVSFVTFLT